MKINKLQDNSLIRRIKKYNCQESANEIILRHENLVYSTIYRFFRKNNHINLKDLLDDKYFIFNKAINTYKEDKNAKFSTWLSYQTYYYCLNCNKNAYKLSIVENKDIDTINNKNNYFYVSSNEKDEQCDYIFNILGQMKDKRIEKIFKLRHFDTNKYNKKKDWKSIGQEVGLSITRVIGLYKQGKKLILKKINSDKYIDII